MHWILPSAQFRFWFPILSTVVREWFRFHLRLVNRRLFLQNNRCENESNFKSVVKVENKR